MKPWLKWTASGLILALLVAGTVRTLSARKSRQTTLETQQITQKTQVSVEVGASDLVSVQSLDLAQGLSISGPLKAVNSAMVKARVPGELLGLTLREGDSVKAGQIIAHIDATESQARVQQARQQAQAAKAQTEIARRNLDNNKALVAQGFISSTALDSSQSTLDAALANLAATQSGVDLAVKSLEDSVLHAPISGLISQRLAQPGERVAVDARVVEIVDVSQLELEASLNAADSLLVKLGQTAQLNIEGAPQSISARVVRINPSATLGSRAVLVYLAISQQGSAGNLRQGLFAQGTLATGSVRALAVPLSAVRTDKPLPYVQVVQQNQVLHQSVKTGVRGEHGGKTMVAVDGVSEGMQLIDGSVGSLRAGTLVKLTPPAQGSK